MNLVRSEWIKVVSTRSAYWMYGLGLLLAVLISALFGKLVSSAAGAEAMADAPGGGGSPLFALTGLPLFTVNFAWIAAVLAVTAEYRFLTVRSTFLATPKRWPEILAKTGLFVVLGMLVTALTIMLCLLLGGALSGLESWTPFSGDGLTFLWRMPVYVGLGVLAVTGVAYLMRNAAGVISLLLVWVLALEAMVAIIPKVGHTIAGWMPFANGTYWALGDVYKGHITWGPGTGLLWYAVVCVVLFASGVALTLKRDA